MSHTDRSIVAKFAADTEGVTAIEYALIAAFIAVAIVASLRLVGGTLQSAFNSVVTSFESILG
jgi:pilus assembly protein Flp/PilA